MIFTPDMAKSTPDLARFTPDMAKSTPDLALAFYVSIMLIKELDAIEKALQDLTRFYKNLVSKKGSLDASLLLLTVNNLVILDSSFTFISIR